MADGAQPAFDDETGEIEALKAFLRDNPALVRDDAELLTDLGLRIDLANIVDFGPAALSRVTAAHKRESRARRTLEANARANFAAQAQTHAAVLDLLSARNHSDLARRADDLSRMRFGLLGCCVALEGPDRVPAGWRPLVEGQLDLLLGRRQLARMGPVPTAKGLFPGLEAEVGSVALIRLAIWEPARQGLLAFASADPDTFDPDMGAELVDFLARVVERTAERWPVL
jgi:uncharacterized protein YigA (DUF484 family)